MQDNIPEVCQKCKLYEGCKTPWMNGRNWDGSDIDDRELVLFVGESPGAQEDEEGLPFVGRSGELLMETLDRAGLEKSEVRFTNAVRCRPPNNKTPTKRQLQYCQQFLLDEIQSINAKVIVPIGNISLQSLLGVSGITNYNGTPIDRDDAIYVPVFHPAYMLRNIGNESLLDSWISAINAVVEAFDGKSFKEADHEFKYVYPKTLKEFDWMYDYLLDYDGTIVCDIESVNVDLFGGHDYGPDYPENVILSAGFATADGYAFVFPLRHKDSMKYYPPSGRNGSPEEMIIYAEETFKDILLAKQYQIIFHNGKFDAKAIKYFYDIDVEYGGDTLQLSRLINPYRGVHGLKRLAGIHLNMFDYDKPLGDYIAKHPECDYGKGGHYGNIPLDILLPYNGKDIAATVLLEKVLLDQLTETQKNFYYEGIMLADKALNDIEYNGFKISPYMAGRYLQIYGSSKDKLELELIKDPDVQQYIENELNGNADLFNPNSRKQMHRILFGYSESTKEYDAIYKQLQPIALTAKGHPSIKRSVLKDMVNILTNELETHNSIVDYADFLDSTIRFLNALAQWKLINSMLSKCIYPANGLKNSWHNGKDWRVRSSYTIGGAVTGRTSSASPNLQNIPTPEKEPGTLLSDMPIKNMFTHTWKRKIDVTS